VDVVAHELAHSWTGNLVTNATAEHFWLNEGFTVWAERKILKALRGEEAFAFGWAIGQKALDDSMARFTDQPELTKLRTHLEGVDPDDAFSSIPYEKGARLVALMEREAGEAIFAAFVQAYMKRFRFTSITTEQFCAFAEEQLPGLLARIGADAWLHQPGMPVNAPVFRAEALEKLESLAQAFPGARPEPAVMKAWSATELLVFLQHLPRSLASADLAWLDEALGLTARGNYEILVEWLVISGGSGFEPVFPRIREVLSRVGRMKYLRPLYMALGRQESTRALARDIFAKAAPGYHGLSRRVVQGVMDKYPA
jgi:hypothetical protein